MLQNILSILMANPNGLTAMELNTIALGEGSWHPRNRSKLYLFQTEIQRGLDNGSIELGEGLRLVVGKSG